MLNSYIILLLGMMVGYFLVYVQDGLLIYYSGIFFCGYLIYKEFMSKINPLKNLCNDCEFEMVNQVSYDYTLHLIVLYYSY